MPYESENNLLDALAGESVANQRYLMYAEKAEKEGYPQVAHLFRVIARAETVHARNHFNAMDGIGTTKDNLTAAVMGEHQEFTRMYPPFVEKAKQEGNIRAEKSFTYANEVEQVHHKLFDDVLMDVKEGKQLKDVEYYVCQVCGNTIIVKPTEKCAICGSAPSVFVKID